MRPIVKLRNVNGSRFLAVPKELVEKISVDHMAVKMDDFGRLIYTPVVEVV